MVFEALTRKDRSILIDTARCRALVCTRSCGVVETKSDAPFPSKSQLLCDFGRLGDFIAGVEHTLTLGRHEIGKSVSWFYSRYHPSGACCIEQSNPGLTSKDSPATKLGKEQASSVNSIALRTSALDSAIVFPFSS